MEKYLGNKRSILPTLFRFVEQHCIGAKSLFDVFSGTTNVARHFQNNGYQVVSNDINRFTSVLAKTYIEMSDVPNFEGLNIPRASEESLAGLKKKFTQQVAKDNGQLFPKEKMESIWTELLSTAKVLVYLNSLNSQIEGQEYELLEHYTVYGSKSDYQSLRGTKTKRNYFSKENVIHLENILEVIKGWKTSDTITEIEYATLLTSVLEEVVLVANVNGTFHDFNRKKLYPNALQTFSLKMPLIYSKIEGGISLCMDALETRDTNADILYIDPPYNSRQYYSYYHFLNFLAQYCELDSVSDYLQKITYVRGQNPDDDFKSDFCFKDKFMKSLKKLIEESSCRFVVMSYYGGKNHWNHWGKEETPTDNGFEYLSEYFSNTTTFKRFEYEIISRQNYQSQSGLSKQFVAEYLFFVEKNTPSDLGSPLGTFGSYQIFEKLGKGGMGVVHKACHVISAKSREQGGNVAIKFPNESAEVRFNREAEAGILLRHPNIVKVYDLVRENNKTGIVMELLEGEDFQSILDNHTDNISWERIKNWVEQICKAMSYAHQKGIVHRDLKPSNIFLTTSNEVKILDFGLAKCEGLSKITQTNVVIGTPAYMAPEQREASHKVDERADIYSLGLIILKLITGTFHDVERLPKSIQQGIEKSLHLNPKARQKSMIEFAQDLGIVVE